MSDSRNLIMAVVLSGLVLFGWSFLQRSVVPPTANPPATVIAGGRERAVPNPAADPTADAPAAVRDRAQVLRDTPRVAIRTPLATGSINLVGARVDDLVLTRYSESIAANAPRIRLLSPAGAPGALFAQYGFSGAGAPPADARWRADGTELAPGRPLTLSWVNAAGQEYQIVLTVADDYLFRVEQRVVNRGAQAATARPYGLIGRTGTGPDKSQFVAHVGLTAVFDGKLSQIDYDEIEDGEVEAELRGRGWLGFSDQYWLTALIGGGEAVEGNLRYASGGRYQADLAQPALVAAPGRVAGRTSMLFAGAKENAVLERITNELGVPQFYNAIDWGWFGFLAKPIFALLTWLFAAVGNFGVAIMLLTLLVRLALFPVANKQFQSMNRMKVLAPKLKAIQERHKDDRAALQTAMMELYRKEKVNPVSGCLPILLQIPIFFALYKALLLTIEMRHQPFVLWVRDLSAPDPLTPLNLFGLLPFSPPAFIAIGVLPILLGITMWLQQKLNPTPMDPVQKQVFAVMPWVFMFIMAPFAAGLQLYWATNNTLSIAQQWWLAKKNPAPAPA